MSHPQRLSTGIAELDQMLRGGFMRGDAVMLAGSAGTGKTTFGLQYLTSGIGAGENGLYISFEQLPDQIYRDAKQFGWDLAKMESENRLRVITTSPDLLVGDGDAEALLEQPISEVNPRRIVIDSLSHISMYIDDEDIRKEAYRMISYFKTKGISSLMIWESPQILGQSFSVSDIGLSFLVDAIVSLKFVEIQSSIHRALVVMKLRGSDHDKSLREYEIGKNGIKVQATFKDYEGIMTGNPTRSSADKFAELFSRAAKEK